MSKALINSLKKAEQSAIINVMSFMSYNPSIGRVLEKDGVKKFEPIVQCIVTDLTKNKICDYADFDRLHEKWTTAFIRSIKTNNQNRCSYGQAQKAINVFLKLYVDWAKMPNRIFSQKVLKYLHVPLDSILMSEIKIEYSTFYSTKIVPIRDKYQPFSLSKINRNQYYIWQNFFREQYHSKPLLFDIIWALKR